jgi:hypothetical protein
MAVDTKKVPNRRKLHFATLEDIVADVDHLNQGPVKALGNWSGGQILKHLAVVMNTSIDGSPLRMAWPWRVMGRLLKGYVLKKGMPPGFELRGRQGADALLPSETSWEEGLRQFRDAMHRLQTETTRVPSPFMGPMTREEWDQLHCRHSELHLSFLTPANE